MTTTAVRLIILAAALPLAALSGRADAGSYAQVIKERDSVLSQILAEKEGRRSSGLADEDAIAAARMALYSFRRDVAAAPGEKIKNQELIVRVLEKKLESVKAKASSGVVSQLEVLEATDSVLAAKQAREELGMKEKKS